MFNIALMAANLLKDLVLDQAQSLAKEHIQNALDRNPELKQVIDQAVSEDNTHDKNKLEDLL